MPQPGEILEQQRTAFELAGMPDGWLRLGGLLLSAALLYGVVWLYRRESRAGAGLRLRLALAGLRCGVVLLLVVVLLEPVMATYTRRIIPSHVLLLVDDSASMAIRDVAAEPLLEGEAAPPARIEQVLALLTGRDQAWMHRLAHRNRLTAYAFGETLVPLGEPREDAAPEASDAVDTGENGSARTKLPTAAEIRTTLRASQPLTDLGGAISLAMELHPETPLAAVVVITDGQINAGMPVEEIALLAQRARAPVYAVGVGAAEEPPNLRITSLSAPATVSMGDPIELRVQAAASGVAETPVELEITARRRDAAGGAAGEEQVVARRSLTLGGAAAAADLDFRIETREAGEIVYAARLSPLEHEAILSDNEASAAVQVLDDKLRVLLVSGRPSYEYRFVSVLLERDRTIDLSCWLQSADAQAVRDGNTVITELPRTPEQLFRYDAVLLLDPDPRELDSSWALSVRRLVDEFGGGVLYQCGPQFATRFFGDPRMEELSALLPVTPDPDAGVRLSEHGAFRTRSMGLRVPERATGHALLRLTDRQHGDAAVWEALPPLWWHYPVLREKALASVLMRAGSGVRVSGDDGPILLAAQPFGAGRVAFLGFDGTHRWRSVAEPAFNRFWVQTVRYLSQARRQGGGRRGGVVLDKERYNVGDYARIEARVLDAGFAPWHEEEIAAELLLPDGSLRPLRLSAVPEREGWFMGRLAIDFAGPAVVRVPLPDGEGPDEDGAPEVLVGHLRALRPDLEMRALRLNAEPLMRLAQQTGGRYMPLAEADRLTADIENADQVRTTRGADRPLWDRGWLLMILAIALCVEWFVRRRNHLL